MTSDLQELRNHLGSGRLSISRLEDGSGAALDIETERLFSFNATGLFIVDSAADESTDEEWIVRSLVSRFGVSRDVARHDLARFLEELVQAL